LLKRIKHAGKVTKKPKYYYSNKKKQVIRLKNNGSIKLLTLIIKKDIG